MEVEKVSPKTRASTNWADKEISVGECFFSVPFGGCLSNKSPRLAANNEAFLPPSYGTIPDCQQVRAGNISNR